MDQFSAEVSFKTIEYSKQTKMIAEYQTKNDAAKRAIQIIQITLGFNVWTTTWGQKVCKWKGSPAAILEYPISNMRGDLAAISIN